MTLRTRKNIGSTRAQQCTTVAAAVALALAASSAARAAQTVAAADTASEGAELSEVIVTGTRQGGLEAAESPAPVQILSSEALQTAAGNPDLMSVLAQLVPSLQMQAFGFDMAGQTLMARLRGMSPNHVLILVNGKRRHTSANIQVDAGSAFEGGANTDLNFIPVDAIDHIEVLTEGAAAQYGTDAIAGVINIILKKNTQGGTLTATDGRNYDDQGLTSDVSGNAGFGPDDNTYFDITGEVHNHGHTNHSGADPRAVNEATTYPNTNMLGLPGYPFLNHIEGDAETHTKLALINAGVGITPDIEAYTTMSYGYKEAASYENYRTPERISATVGGVTTYPFPFGFNPEEGTHETDYQGTFGFKGALDTWNWDLATSYGKDKVEEYTLNTIGNTYTDTTSPFYGDPTASNFYDGYLQASQWTTTLDLNRDFDVGMAGPLNVAVGGEYRRETYTIGAGVPGAYLSGGPQSFAGLAPTDAGSHDRTNEAVYVDLAGKPIENLRVDLAGRYEHYSDFGSAEVGKLTARYDFTPVIAARGTISNGFRAPTLAEEYFSSTNVGPTSATVVLPPNSKGGKLLGLGNGLQAEKSTNVSFGVVLRPLPAMSLTLDLYQINMTNRIVATGDIYATYVGGNPTAAADAIRAAIAANGRTIDPVVLASGGVAVQTFANGLDTRTRGLDLAGQYGVDYPLGHVNYTLTGTITDTALTNNPAALSPAIFAGQSLYDTRAISDLTESSPKFVFGAGADWTWNNLTVNVLEKLYGPSAEWANDGGHTLLANGQAEYFKSTIGTIPITNLDLGYKLNKYLKVDVGALNLFDRYPPLRNSQMLGSFFAHNNSTAVQIQPIWSPFGIDGGYYYAKATFSF
jgi:iron complex outermembrane receptor protein